MTDEEPIFRRADLLPIEVEWHCPVCQTPHFAQLVEDDSGLWSVPMENRFVQCDECESNIDIGWSGWRWLDGSEAPPSPATP